MSSQPPPENMPNRPKNSFRITLKVTQHRPRLDSLLLEALRTQNENPVLKNISRVAFKELFNKKRVLIKGQIAKPSSSLAVGTTYVDILGFGEK